MSRAGAERSRFALSSTRRMRRKGTRAIAEFWFGPWLAVEKVFIVHIAVIRLLAVPQGPSTWCREQLHRFEGAAGRGRTDGGCSICG